MNPFLPPWEYIPDGEPYIFGGRVYVYGSHDRAHGYVFCQNDYVCWSAPAEDLTSWRYEGVIYKKTADPLNRDGHMVLYAPDVTRGPDGRYYLYYVLDKANVVSVAVCDTPAGEYEFYGYVKYPDGTRLGEKDGDEPQFDPGLLTEGGATYLYTGISIIGDASRKGAMAAVLDKDMLTIKEAPVYIVPGGCHGKGTGFEGHEFFEASSMRKVGDDYYFIYSSVHMTELCYATSKSPTKGFKYGGVIVSNCDLGIAHNKTAEKRTYPYGNNHGSIIEINGQWYVFYHRMTNGTWFSRQGCIEPIEINAGGIRQAEMTSQGAGRVPFQGLGEYPAYMACVLYNDKVADKQAHAVGVSGSSTNSLYAKYPKITQDAADTGPDMQKTENPPGCYIADITDSTVIGFRYFDFKGIKKLTLTTRAYGKGEFEIRTSPDGEVWGRVPIVSANIWTGFSAPAAIPDGVHALYLIYKGTGSPHLKSFTLE